MGSNYQQNENHNGIINLYNAGLVPGNKHIKQSRNDEPLRPTVRYWNLLQLATNPLGLNHLTIDSSHELVTSAALGDISEGIFAIHLVNNGASREARLSGLPEGVDSLRIFTTNADSDMVEGDLVRVQNGEAVFTLEATSFVSLMTP